MDKGQNLAMSQITLIDRTERQPPDLRGRYPVLTGERQWLVHGPSEQVDAVHAALKGISEQITPDTLLLSFGNAVGLLDIPHYGRVEIVSGKWRREHFMAMLAELTEIAAGLPFAAGTIAALPYERIESNLGEDVLYHMFVYLRHILSSESPAEQPLLPALHTVLHAPHQRFNRERRSVPLALAQHVDTTTLDRLIANADKLVEVSDDVAKRVPLATALGNRLPERVDEQRITHTNDTIENRFVRMLLETALEIIERMRVAATRERDTFAQRIVQDCDQLEQALQPIIRLRFWEEIGKLHQWPTNSTVLQERRGYRAIYQHYIRLRLASRVPLSSEQVRDLLEAKDIALLYEIWSFFVLAHALSHILGQPIAADRPRTDSTEMRIPWEFEIRWVNEVRLLYNPRFSPTRGRERRSYSLPLRPDMALEIGSGIARKLHLFDAKFRLQRLDEIFPENAHELASEEQAAERRGVFKRSDLYKMHTYRDAIHGAQSVWMLYPGSESRFYGGAGMWQPGQPLPTELAGVGALALVPGEESGELKSVLRHLLEQSRNV